jgi:hypothetical protein
MYYYQFLRAGRFEQAVLGAWRGVPWARNEDLLAGHGRVWQLPFPTMNFTCGPNVSF